MGIGESEGKAGATLSIPYDSTLLIQGTQYPTSNLVMTQLYQKDSKLEIPNTESHRTEGDYFHR